MSHLSRRQINFTFPTSLSLSKPLSSMSSNLKLSYQRLRFLSTENDHHDSNLEAAAEPKQLLFKTSWLRFSRNRLQQRQRWQRRRRQRIRVAGLRRLLRRKVNFLKSVVRASVDKVLKRFKEGKPYMAELFAGNYMFMQVNPSPTLGHLEKSYKHGLFPVNSTRFMDIPRVP